MRAGILGDVRKSFVDADRALGALRGTLSADVLAVAAENARRALKRTREMAEKLEIKLRSIRCRNIPDEPAFESVVPGTARLTYLGVGPDVIGALIPGSARGKVAKHRRKTEVLTDVPKLKVHEALETNEKLKYFGIGTYPDVARTAVGMEVGFCVSLYTAIPVPETGFYRWEMTADDGSVLLVNGQILGGKWQGMDRLPSGEKKDYPPFVPTREVYLVKGDHALCELLVWNSITQGYVIGTFHRLTSGAPGALGAEWSQFSFDGKDYGLPGDLR